MNTAKTHTRTQAFRITSHDFEHGAKQIANAFHHHHHHNFNHHHHGDSCHQDHDVNHNADGNDTIRNHQRDDVTTNTDQSTCTYLHQWEMRESFGITCLTHPPVLVAYEYTSHEHGDTDTHRHTLGHDHDRMRARTDMKMDQSLLVEEDNEMGKHGGDEEEEDWIDNSVDIAPDSTYISGGSTSTFDRNHSRCSHQHHSPQYGNSYQYVEWKFSAVYSHVWGVPVLYFEVHSPDGRPLSREELLGHLNRNRVQLSSSGTRTVVDMSVDVTMATTGIMNMDENENNSGGDGDDDDDEEEEAQQHWTFVSQEEHPATGIPSFFFHPCQTSKRLQLVLDLDGGGDGHLNAHGATLDTSTSTDQSKSGDRKITDSKERHQIPGCIILTWLSMIIQAAGFRISANVFQRLDSELRVQSRSRN